MNNCLGCRKSVTNVYSIDDTVDSVKISDLVAFFLHLEVKGFFAIENLNFYFFLLHLDIARKVIE